MERFSQSPLNYTKQLDLDGTIADTLPLIFDAYRHTVAPWVKRPPTDTEVETTFGPSERE